ncbi:MAG TPA: hypothetical protein VIB00_05495 [Pyrinomonadaceae bacterium]|jgi:hypothetical protein
MQKAKYILFLALALLVLAFIATTAVGQKRVAESSPAQQPLLSEYKGVRLGMPAGDVATRLGQPAQHTDDQDFFVISETETAQIVYDKNQNVKTISVDYFGGVGAPDYKMVVGNDVQVRPDGSVYKLVRYEAHGFWVSYSRTAGTAVIVSITLQSTRK